MVDYQMLRCRAVLSVWASLCCSIKEEHWQLLLRLVTHCTWVCVIIWANSIYTHIQEREYQLCMFDDFRLLPVSESSYSGILWGALLLCAPHSSPSHTVLARLLTATVLWWRICVTPAVLFITTIAAHALPDKMTLPILHSFHISFLHNLTSRFN